MSNRTTALIGLSLFVLIATLVAVVTRGGRATTDAVQPPSTYLSGPGGASGLAEALPRIGVMVERSRRPWRELRADVDSSLFVVLEPTTGVTPRDAARLVDRSRNVGPVLVAGRGASTVLSCWGFGVLSRGRDSIRVTTPGHPPAPDAPWVSDVLVPAAADEPQDDRIGSSTGNCAQVRGKLDTLLVTAGNRPVLVRVTPKSGHPAYLASDGALFSNQVLRSTAAGPMVLGLFRDIGHHAAFDEFHHGYSDGGSLNDAVLDWSYRSPWGWSVWQLVVVGLLALAAAMVRFGPVRSVLRRARRSPLEHVKALATALQAARGHDVAVELLVRGLRRRLSRDGRAGREPAAQWLASLAGRTRSARARAAAGRLRDLTRPRRSVDDVLAAANAVEDVWQELRP